MTHETPMAWHAALDHCQRHGTPHVLATQMTSAGSTPREPGARMVITEHAVFDTLGGGTFEWQTIQQARSLLSQRQAGFSLESFSLGGRSGQCCGGLVNVLLEVFLGATAHIALFGAGHVGREIVKLSAPLPWQLDWYDSRADAFQSDVPRARLSCHLLGDVGETVAGLPLGTHALVMTHDHDEDYALIKGLLERADIVSIGLIGSDSKWASFKGRLSRAGVDQPILQRVRCPIGSVRDTKLSNKTPYAIALSVVTELLWLTDQPYATETRGLDSATLRALFAPTATHSS